MLSGINISSALGIAAPSDLFSQKELAALIAQSERTLQAYAVAFSNGNVNLAKGIAKQLEVALSLYAKNKELPVELNLGMSYVYNDMSLCSSRSCHAYSSRICWSHCFNFPSSWIFHFD